MVPPERALMSSYMPLIHSNFSSICTRFGNIAAFVIEQATFPTPPLVHLKFPHVPLDWVDGVWATNSEGVGLIVQFVSTISKLCDHSPLTSQPDGRRAMARPRFALECIAR